MTKPTGAVCNLGCDYCYFLKKENLYPGSSFRMSDAVLERFVEQMVAAQPGPEIAFAWQGGEPTLMGLDFFERAVALAEARRRPHQRVTHSLQTNATKLDDAWGAFLARHGFLVGVSLDGPRALHDRHRRDRGGAGTVQTRCPAEAGGPGHPGRPATPAQRRLRNMPSRARRPAAPHPLEITPCMHPLPSPPCSPPPSRRPCPPRPRTWCAVPETCSAWPA
jgi:hypothetical protein